MAWSDPVLRPALGLVAVAAGFLLPVPGLLVPLLARDRQWGAGSGGVLAGSIALGIVLVAVTVTATGALPRPGIAAAGGLALAGAAVLALAYAQSVTAAVASAVVAGLGSGVFSTHAGHLILGGAPSTHLARVQSVLVLAQSLPLLVTNNALGTLADALTADSVLLVCAGSLAAGAALGLRSPALRAVPDAGSRLAAGGVGNAGAMQTPSPSPGMPSEPLPIAQVTTGMTVVDATGEEVGTVTDVKMSGTAAPDDVPAELRAGLAEAGFLRVDGSGLAAGDFYVPGPQVTGVTTTGDDGVVRLAVRKDDLHRAG